MTDRTRQVQQVLWRVFLLNLIVAAAKIATGMATGAVSVLSDGFHSLTDTASNIVALFGVQMGGCLMAGRVEGRRLVGSWRAVS